MFLSFRTIVAMTAVGLATAASHAVIIKDGSNNTLFYDNFEGVSPVSTTDHPDASGDYDPVAITGAWTNAEPSGITRSVQVANYGTPGAFQGTQYLRNVRQTSTSSTATNSFATFALQTTGTLHAEFMYYAVNTASLPEKNFGFGIQLTEDDSPSFGDKTASDYRFLLGNRISDHMIRHYAPNAGDNNGTYTDTGVTYIPNQWQKWVVDVDLNARTYSFSIDGGTPSAALPFFSINQSASGTFYFNNGADSSAFLLDAVPEPASIAMFGLAGLLLAGRRRGA